MIPPGDVEVEREVRGRRDEAALPFRDCGAQQDVRMGADNG